MDTEKLTLNVAETCIKLGVSAPSLRKAIKKGEVPVILIGHRVLIPVSALQRYLENAGTQPVKA